ncbi:MAG: bifunctional folylpolyglutamate synthase/dihydrofolate synthase [Chloroflexi bacterium]|nr:bifunctional folylpolyglutamate synthase/dihydrofolate synthase [Chloroflexota bacterium]
MDHNKKEAFEEAITYLYSFINLERKQQDRYLASKMDATRPRRLLKMLGAPQTQYASVHVAGTKGKGSVSAICAACLRAAGLKVGLYTSPHLVDFRERIRVLSPDDADGRIPKDRFVALLDHIKTLLPQFPNITWFEIVTAVTFLYFAEAEVDIAVIEVGLGGRLDSTNVLSPLVSVITSLSLDHTKLLGNTLAQIAYEKGGIIKPGIPVISAPQPDEALQKLREITTEREAPLAVVGQDWAFSGDKVDSPIGSQQLRIIDSPSPDFIPDGAEFQFALAGEHQLENGAVAIAALDVVRHHVAGLTETAVRRGLANVQWPGRLQIVHQGDGQSPTLLVDCAHNPDSAEKLRHALKNDYKYDQLWFVFGAPGDKDVGGVIEQLLPLAAGVITTTANHPRSATPEALVEICEGLGGTAVPAEDMAAAITLAWQQAAPNDLICVAGSIIVVGDLLNQWDSLQSVLLNVQTSNN